MKNEAAIDSEKSSSMLFEPAELGSMSLRNKFVRSATAEVMFDDRGRVTDKIARLYSRLGKGGVGLIITGNFFVSTDGRAIPKTPVLDDDVVIDDIGLLAKAAHEHGAKVVAQLNHGGRQCDPEVLGRTPVAPSAVRYNVTGVKPRAMTDAEIQDTIAAYGRAAQRAKAAGYDGVQIHGSHGYLVSQFLSPQTNRREDKWGGTRENRARFVLAVYDAIRAGVGDDYPVLIKLGVVDERDGWLPLEESLDVSDELAERGITAIEVSGGNNHRGLFSIRGDVPSDVVTRGRGAFERLAYRFFIQEPMRRVMRFEEGYFLSHAAAVKDRVGSRTKVIAVGGIRRRESMEQILESGQADFVSLSRPLIRQPSLIRKMERDPNAETSCVSCNRCIMEVGLHYQPLKCYLTRNSR